MDIIKAFQNNDIGINITIKGTHEDPLFRASDVGIVLGIVNIRNATKSFDDTEKVVRQTDTPGGSQEVVFLTEKGLIQVLCASQKPIAKLFKNWIYNVIKEIRLTGKYELEKQIKIKNEQIQQTLQYNEDNLILNFKNKNVVYIIQVEETIIKFGHAKDIDQRLKDHRKEFGQDIKLIFIYETVYNKSFETMIKEDEIIKPRKIRKKYKSDTIHFELIKLDDKFTLDDLNKRLEYLKERINGDLVGNLLKEIEILKNENIELKNTILNYKNNTNNVEKDLIISQLRVELAESKSEILHINNRQLQYKIDVQNVDNIYEEEEKKIKINQHKYQIYDPDDLHYIKTYKTINELCLEKILFKDACSQSVSRAIKNKTPYLGYRFWKIKQKDEDIEYNIGNTIFVDNAEKYQQIVQLNKDCTEIFGIYSCTREAATEYIKNTNNGGYTKEDITKMTENIGRNLSTNTSLHEYCWRRVSRVSKELIKLYLKGGILPDIKVHKNNKQIEKYLGDKIIHTYNSITETTKEEGMSDTTLRKIYKDNTQYNGFFYRIKSKEEIL